MTPEGRVKKKLKDLLEPFGKSLYQYWPVGNGMGAPALDVIICFNGQFLSIELKAGKKQMTDRQVTTAGNINAAGGMTLMINEHEGWLELQSWLGRYDKQYADT